MFKGHFLPYTQIHFQINIYPSDLLQTTIYVLHEMILV